MHVEQIGQRDELIVHIPPGRAVLFHGDLIHSRPNGSCLKEGANGNAASAHHYMFELNPDAEKHRDKRKIRDREECDGCDLCPGQQRFPSRKQQQCDHFSSPLGRSLTLANSVSIRSLLALRLISNPHGWRKPVQATTIVALWGSDTSYMEALDQCCVSRAKRSDGTRSADIRFWMGCVCVHFFTGDEPPPDSSKSFCLSFSKVKVELAPRLSQRKRQAPPLKTTGQPAATQSGGMILGLPFYYPSLDDISLGWPTYLLSSLYFLVDGASDA